MKAVDLRKLTREELDARIRETRDALFNLRVKFSTGQLEKTAALRAAKRDLARAVTVRVEMGKQV